MKALCPEVMPGPVFFTKLGLLRNLIFPCVPNIFPCVPNYDSVEGRLSGAMKEAGQPDDPAAAMDQD